MWVGRARISQIGMGGLLSSKHRGNSDDRHRRRDGRRGDYDDGYYSDEGYDERPLRRSRHSSLTYCMWCACFLFLALILISALFNKMVAKAAATSAPTLAPTASG